MSDEDEDFQSNLSEGARKMWEHIDLRHHGVGLERVQRIHLGIDSEEMEYSADTIAQMLQEVADRCDEDEAFTIHAVVNALLGKDDDHRLVLRNKRRGKFITPTVHEAKHIRERRWLWWLAHLERKGVKTESAIMEIAAAEKVSRATIFNGVRSAERYQEWGRELSADAPAFQNPRPSLAKKRKT